MGEDNDPNKPEKTGRGAKAASALKSIKNIFTPELKKKAQQIGAPYNVNLKSYKRNYERGGHRKLIQLEPVPELNQKANKILGLSPKTPFVRRSGKPSKGGFLGPG